jgi:integrase/recombinase XerC
MARKITKVKYFTDEKKALVSTENRQLYDKYLNSNIIKNRDVKETTYYQYNIYMTHFLVFLAEKYDNVGLYSEELMENAVDILEDYMGFLQETLLNNKKVVNTKISAISSFYLWSLKRKLISRHPFDKQLDRMKGANDEKIINSYFLDNDQIETVRNGLIEEKRYDVQDRLIWEIMLASANRIGAISKLTLTSLDIENMMFNSIREKRGYRVEVVFDEVGKEILELWLEQRKELDNLSVDALFITKLNNKYRQMSKRTIQERVKKIGEILGLDDFHSHCIRKTKLDQVYRETGDMNLASELANHKSLQTTKDSYIKPQSKSDLREKIAKLKEKKMKEDQEKENT